ncbi:OVARIAN TUMOR DOMAIN-containing deubiquitinating enzyme 1 [Aegilops tauschii subsp. strangulata]|uniref:OVARIAN TUMOR DOMAIN-containing deubiquitinating enzyme 1 n=1 Tax=Aegilops tauschii subsp. strangulata TaxID=200361 RepID=UPI00098A1420|nr:OVARIAN TUMOR DOMAIN-containing deubiquitinating enzyme 1 [Aegilops tauschii subsp. strangulata]
MGTKFRFKVKLYKDRAGSSGDGGGGEPTPPPAPGPAPSPSLDPAALSASPLRLQPPPTPIVRYTYQGQDDDDDDWPEDDGTDLDAGQEDEDELPDDEKFYIPLFMSGQKKNLPHDLFRHDSVPLNKNEYFSLWKNWNQLLDGKRTYLRPLRDRRVLSVSGVFRRPLARPWALEFQEPLLDLVEDYPDNDIVQEMIKILCQRYVHFKRTRGDGSCFYRAFFFSYLENLGQMQDSQAEVTRLMEHVAVSRENFCRLKWDKAYFLNPEEYFSSVASELNHLVNSVANGLSSDELQKRSLQEMMPLRVISLLRLLAETEIRTRIDDYKPFIPGKVNVNQYCWKEVRPLDVKASALAMRALTYALGIPLRLETLGEGLTAGGLQVKRLDFFPRSESGKGAFHIVRSYWSSTTTPEPLEIGSGSLMSSDGTPLLTLLCRPDNCDILYRK